MTPGTLCLYLPTAEQVTVLSRGDGWAIVEDCHMRIFHASADNLRVVREPERDAERSAAE